MASWATLLTPHRVSAAVRRTPRSPAHSASALLQGYVAHGLAHYSAACRRFEPPIRDPGRRQVKVGGAEGGLVDGGQTTARAGGPATSRREREGERGLVVSRGRHSGRGLRVIPCARQREPQDCGRDEGRTAWSVLNMNDAPPPELGWIFQPRTGSATKPEAIGV